MLNVKYNYGKPECNEKYLNNKDNEVIVIEKFENSIPITVEQAKELINQLSEKVMYFQALEIDKLKEDEVRLYRGTNLAELREILSGNVSDVSWWTTNVDNMSHYYEGACIEIVMKHNKDMEMDYIRDHSELIEGYTFGSAEMSCPADSTWYSISKEYFKQNVIRIRQFIPDQTGWYDEEE